MNIASAPRADARLSDRTTRSSVNIALVGGREQAGHLSQFSPSVHDVAVEIRQADSRTIRILLAAERIMFIAFVREGSELGPRPRNGRRIRVHLAGGKTLDVDATSDPAHAIGFYAVPITPGAIGEYFFYAHGINAREELAPLGEFLVKDGVLSPESLKRGLDLQSAARSAPLGQILLEQQNIDESSLDHALELQQRKRLRLGEVLIEAGLASHEAIEAALAEQRNRKGKRLGEILVEMGVVSEVALAATLAKKFQLPFMALDDGFVAPEIAEVPREVVARYGVVALATDARSVTIAISDPLATDVIDAIRVRTKKRVQEVMVVPSRLRRAVERACNAPLPPPDGASVSAILHDFAAESDDGDNADLASEQDIASSDSVVVKLVNQLLSDAVLKGASDIHIEPNGRERAVDVRLRIDGDCVLYQQLPSSLRGSLVARLKIMAGLDIAERRKPQDGKIRFKLGEKPIELRLATLPTVNGNEDVVLRILASSKPAPLGNMGLRPPVLERLVSVLEQPYGLFLCAGPTGSGKTTTLHSSLGHINTQDRKIWTAEDPVEITQPGLRQVQVQPKIGFTFAAAMRSFLRADPDVIMVGEMRDLETASTAIEASLTGHLVLSTLHTNSAPETITRLLDMGLDPFSFSDALLGVLSQRLARALCARCRRSERGTRKEFDEFASLFGGEEEFVRRTGRAWGPDFTVFRASGCAECGNTGYKGRLAIHELLVSTDAIKKAIARKAPVDEVRSLALASGMDTLAQDGALKALDGRTDMRQVLAVCVR